MASLRLGLLGQAQASRPISTRSKGWTQPSLTGRATGGDDRIPERAGPDVLDQGQGRCATGRDGVGDVVHLAVGDQVSVGSFLGA